MCGAWCGWMRARRRRRGRRRRLDAAGHAREFKEWSERTFLVEKLREQDWNISKTADVIDTPRSNLYKKLEQYAITQGIRRIKSPRQFVPRLWTSAFDL
jgi:DNA-binding NtrC family response regulator